MKRLLRYLNDYKKESVLAPLFKMLEASFELFVPLVVAQIVDVGIKNQDAGYILKMGGLLVLLGVIGLTCSCPSRRSILRQSQRLVLLPGCEMTCLPILEACLTVNRILSERLR